MKEESEGKNVDQFWENYMWERENFVFDSLIYLEPVERFKNRSNVMKLMSFGDVQHEQQSSGQVEDDSFA